MSSWVINQVMGPVGKEMQNAPWCENHVELIYGILLVTLWLIS